ncbi:hypothetical protein IAT38_004689 [Cryptococcus sp. DSM 104549]
MTDFLDFWRDFKSVLPLFPNLGLLQLDVDAHLKPSTSTSAEGDRFKLFCMMASLCKATKVVCNMGFSAAKLNKTERALRGDLLFADGHLPDVVEWVMHGESYLPGVCFGTLNVVMLHRQIRTSAALVFILTCSLGRLTKKQIASITDKEIDRRDETTWRFVSHMPYSTENDLTRDAAESHVRRGVQVQEKLWSLMPEMEERVEVEFTYSFGQEGETHR